MQLDMGLRRLAGHALAQYDVTPTRLTFVAESFNTVFRVATTNGPFALRIGPRQRIHAAGTEASELAWQKRLREHGIPAPRIHPTSDGAAATCVGVDLAAGVTALVMRVSNRQRRVFTAQKRAQGACFTPHSRNRRGGQRNYELGSP